MDTTFRNDTDLSGYLGKRVSTEEILSPWIYNTDFNPYFKSPYDIQKDIKKQEGEPFVINENWFLRRNTSDVCAWHFSDRDFGDVGFAIWTTSTYSGLTFFTGLDDGIKT